MEGSRSRPLPSRPLDGVTYDIRYKIVNSELGDTMMSDLTMVFRGEEWTTAWSMRDDNAWTIAGN